MIQGLDYRFFTASDRRSRRKAWLCTATLIVTLGAILLAFSGCVSAYVRQQERTVATRQSAVCIGPTGSSPQFLETPSPPRRSAPK